MLMYIFWGFIILCSIVGTLSSLENEDKLNKLEKKLKDNDII